MLLAVGVVDDEEQSTPQETDNTISVYGKRNCTYAMKKQLTHNYLALIQIKELQQHVNEYSKTRCEKAFKSIGSHIGSKFILEYNIRHLEVINEIAVQYYSISNFQMNLQNFIISAYCINAAVYVTQ